MNDRRPKALAFLATLLVVLWFLPAHSAEISGRVVGVTDGDTLTLLAPGNQQFRVRLSEIDAPESGQPGGQAAKQALSALVFARQVRVSENGRDQYGRTLGRVYVDDKDVNAELVRNGSVWVYRQYLTDRSLLLLEDQARRDKRGLWSLAANQITPPWEWRGGQRTPTRASRPASASSTTCGTKRFCREMTSCSEARHFLNACGVRTLDGDRDGVPCEALCR